MNRDVYPREYYETKYPRVALSPIREGLIRLILKYCKGRGKLLEIGCAKGTFLSALEPFFNELDGVDISAYAISESHKYVTKAETYQCDVEKEYRLKEVIDNRTFDVIVSLHTFEHFEDPRGVLRSCFDLLKDDGHLFLVVPNPKSLLTKVYGVLGRKEACKVFADKTHKCALPKNEWEKLIRQAGFRWEFKGTPFFIINNRFLDRLYPFHYSGFLGETGFELLFVCRKR